MMRTLALLTVAVGMILGSGITAQRASTPTCDAVAASPKKFVGQSVVFYGSSAGGEIRQIGGQSRLLNAWTCKMPSGEVVPKGDFGTIDNQTTVTPAAGKADTAKELFRISGVVGDMNTVNGTSMPFLTKARIELASETK
jgi:hypothetical protein